MDGWRVSQRTFVATIGGRLLQLRQVYFVENGVAFVLTCGAPQVDFSRYAATFEQIMGSFTIPAR